MSPHRLKQEIFFYLLFFSGSFLLCCFSQTSLVKLWFGAFLSAFFYSIFIDNKKLS